jgi:hypothetical protein
MKNKRLFLTLDQPLVDALNKRFKEEVVADRIPSSMQELIRTLLTQSLNSNKQ